MRCAGWISKHSKQMGAKIVNRVGLVDHCLHPQGEKFLHPIPGDLFAEDNDLRTFRLRDFSEGSAELDDFLPLWNRSEDHQIGLQQPDLDRTLVEVPCHEDLMGVGGAPKNLFQESLQESFVSPLGLTEKGIW
jgi:hypothetical protein